MKPAPFDYLKPRTADEAMALLRRHPDAAVLAGGQSLVAMLNMRLVTPSHLIDIGGLDELRGESVHDGWLRLGALARHSEVASSDLVAEHAPLLAQAVAHIGHPAIRNRGTLGGSLALADPAAELPACLLALGGRIEITGAQGRRRIAAQDFFQGSFETALRPGELLSGIEVPVRAEGERTAIDELARRHGDYALAGLAAWCRLADGKVVGARLAYFGVADRPVLAPTVAAALDGKALDDAVIEAAAALLADDIDPLGQPGCTAATKLHLAAVLTRRVLAGVAAQGG